MAACVSWCGGRSPCWPITIKTSDRPRDWRLKPALFRGSTRDFKSKREVVDEISQEQDTVGQGYGDAGYVRANSWKWGTQRKLPSESGGAVADPRKFIRDAMAGGASGRVLPRIVARPSLLQDRGWSRGSPAWFPGTGKLRAKSVPWLIPPLPQVADQVGTL